MDKQPGNRQQEKKKNPNKETKAQENTANSNRPQDIKAQVS